MGTYVHIDAPDEAIEAAFGMSPRSMDRGRSMKLALQEWGGDSHEYERIRATWGLEAESALFILGYGLSKMGRTTCNIVTSLGLDPVCDEVTHPGLIHQFIAAQAQDSATTLSLQAATDLALHVTRVYWS